MLTATVTLAGNGGDTRSLVYDTRERERGTLLMLQTFELEQRSNLQLIL